MTANDTSEDAGGFTTTYRRWADAEGTVSEFEKAVFHDGRLPTAPELACLRILRGVAAMQLHRLINEMDAELGRLHAQDAAAAKAAAKAHPTDGVFLAASPQPSPSP